MPFRTRNFLESLQNHTSAFATQLLKNDIETTRALSETNGTEM